MPYSSIHSSRVPPAKRFAARSAPTSRSISMCTSTLDHSLQAFLIITPRTQSCHHRLCKNCLLDTFEALFLRRVLAASHRLPGHLRQPPAVITPQYLQDVRDCEVSILPRCPFCSGLMLQIPLKFSLYSSILTIASDIIVTESPNTGNMYDRAGVSHYFA